jgi:hypothetical protein
MSENQPTRAFTSEHASNRYVAFVDILGFGRRVLDEFDVVLGIYRELLDRQPILVERHKTVSIRILSDAFIVTSETFQALIPVVVGLHMITLLQDCLIRGGIGFGKHVEARDERDFIVVSQGLVHAVAVEKTIRRPCVAIHDSVQLPEWCLDPRLHPLERGVIRFDGIPMICPFNPLWGHSAMTRVAMLYEQHPEHADKYDWFLRLYDAFHSGDRLT